MRAPKALRARDAHEHMTQALHLAMLSMNLDVVRLLAETGLCLVHVHTLTLLSILCCT